MLKYMLDANICIFTIKNKPQQVRDAFNRHHGQLCTSSVSLMELIYEAEEPANPERNLAVVEGFAVRLEMLPYDELAASHTGQLRAELARNGTPIGPYDQLIAGHLTVRRLKRGSGGAGFLVSLKPAAAFCPLCSVPDGGVWCFSSRASHRGRSAFHRWSRAWSGPRHRSARRARFGGSAPRCRWIAVS